MYKIIIMTIITMYFAFVCSVNYFVCKWIKWELHFYNQRVRNYDGSLSNIQNSISSKKRLTLTKSQIFMKSVVRGSFQPPRRHSATRSARGYIGSIKSYK